MTLYDIIREWLKTNPEMNWEFLSHDSSEDSGMDIYCSKCRLWIGVIEEDHVALRHNQPDPYPFIEILPTNPDFFNQLKTLCTHPCEEFVKLYSPPKYTLAS